MKGRTRKPKNPYPKLKEVMNDDTNSDPNNINSKGNRDDTSVPESNSVVNCDVNNEVGGCGNVDEIHGVKVNNAFTSRDTDFIPVSTELQTWTIIKPYSAAEIVIIVKLQDEAAGGKNSDRIITRKKEGRLKRSKNIIKKSQRSNL